MWCITFRRRSWTDRSGVIEKKKKKQSIYNTRRENTAFPRRAAEEDTGVVCRRRRRRKPTDGTMTINRLAAIGVKLLHWPSANHKGRALTIFISSACGFFCFARVRAMIITNMF